MYFTVPVEHFFIHSVLLRHRPIVIEILLDLDLDRSFQSMEVNLMIYRLRENIARSAKKLFRITSN